MAKGELKMNSGSLKERRYIGVRRARKRSMGVGEALNHSLYCFKLKSFSFSNTPNGVLSSFHGGEKQREGGRDSRDLLTRRG